MNLAYNAKPVKLMKGKDAPFHGAPVIMLIIPTVLINGRVRRKLNAHSARMCGILLKLQSNDRMIRKLCFLNY